MPKVGMFTVMEGNRLVRRKKKIIRIIILICVHKSKNENILQLRDKKDSSFPTKLRAPSTFCFDHASIRRTRNKSEPIRE